MHNDAKGVKGRVRQNANVSDIGLLDDVESRLHDDPSPGSSRFPIPGGQRRSPGNNEDNSSQTVPSQLESGQGFQSNVRPYVAELERFIAGYRAGEQTKLEVTSAVIEILGKDPDLSTEETLRSFELYMAEINAAETFTRKPGERGPTKPQTARARLSSLLTNESHQRRDGGSDGGDLSSSSESGDDEPRK